MSFSAPDSKTLKQSLFFSFVVAASAAAGPQQEPPPSPAPPRFGAGVEVVSMPIFVTDREGRPLSGLTAEDLIVEDEGLRVPIVALSEIDASTPAGLEQIKMRPAARRQFLLLFDQSFSSPAGLVRSRAAATDFVERQLGPYDLASVAAFSILHGIEVIVGFTPDRAQLIQAIETLGVMARPRAGDPLGLVFDFNSGRSAGIDAAGGGASDQLLSFLQGQQVPFSSGEGERYRQLVSQMLRDLSSLAEALDAVQGRKQIILLSAGFDQSTLFGVEGEHAVADSEAIARGRIWEVQSENRYGDSRLRRGLDDMIRALARADCVVHTLDVTGLETQASVSRRRLGSGRESLIQIAHRSGGRSFKDTNDLASAFGQILDDTEHFYLLVFEPGPRLGANRFHRLDVKTDKRGYSISHRSGFTELPPFEDQSPLFRRLAAADRIAKGASGGSIVLDAIAVPYKDETGLISLPLVLEIDALSLLSQSESPTVVLELLAYAFGPTGAVEDVMAVTTELDVAQARDRGSGGLQIHSTLSLPRGTSSLRLMIRDRNSGRTGFYNREVEMPDFEKGLVVYPPLLMADPDDVLVLRVPARRTPHLAQPFKLRSGVFVPRALPRLTNAKTDRLCVMFHDAGTSADPDTVYDVRSALLAPNGRAMPDVRFTLESAESGADGFRRFVLAITPTNVPAGDYTLRVQVIDPESGQPSRVFQAIKVE